MGILSELTLEYKESILSGHAGGDDSSQDGFLATNELQVESLGYDFNQALSGSRMLENISVYVIERGVSVEEKYTSIRLKRNSNSCALVRQADPRQNALISTVYRWGPGRNPRMRILSRDVSASVEQAISDGSLRGELIEVKSRSIVSRAQIFNTSFGRLEWRYGSRGESKAYNADSLLILERVDCSVLPDGAKNERRPRIAQLIRNHQFRTPGSVRYSGGNGGRLLVDLRTWKDEKYTNTDNIEAFIVASCILMLKREADRFINNSIATIA